MRLTLILIVFISFYSCKNSNEKADAYGNFEADEYLISSEVSGKLLSFNISEGNLLKKGESIGIIDTTQISLKIAQLHAQRSAVETRMININGQVSVQEEQKNILIKEIDRFKKLFKEGAATQKTIDDLRGQVDVINKQIASIKTQKIPIQSELKSIDLQIAQLEDQLNKSTIINPVKGTVLEKYINEQEIVTTGKSLYKIANLEEMELKAYITGTQLPHIKIGQEVRVWIDKTEKENQPLSGKISWISSEAEFTPKIIQTKEERVDQVYAIKVKVQNDGRIKIGMPGEIDFNHSEE